MIWLGQQLKESFEFRVSEKLAKQYLPDDLGYRLSGITRKIVLPSSSKLLVDLISLDKKLRGRFLGSFSVIRRYSASDFRRASAFCMFVCKLVETCGEQFGTPYDESAGCEYCCAGAKQTGDLVLDKRTLKPTERPAFIRTIGGETIISRPLMAILLENQIVGAEFLPIRINKSSLEHSADWFQFRCTSNSYRIVEPTKVVDDFFGLSDEELEHKIETNRRAAQVLATKYGLSGSWCVMNGYFRCPLGHTIGRYLATEVSVCGKTPHGISIANTIEHLGHRTGYLRPEPAMIVSPQLRQLLLDHNVKGVSFEVAHVRETGEPV